MRWFYPRFMPAARLAAVLLCTYGVFQVALYLWMNCPGVARQRMDHANVAVVERSAIIYRANGWPGMDPDTAEPPDADDETMLATAALPEHADCFCADP